MSNDNTESISAKLRRWADESESDNRRHFYPTFNACDDLGIKVPDDDFVSERELFRRIADEIDREKREIAERYACQSWMNPADAIAKLATGEIEWAELQQAIDRYYLPRPLFDDGEPVQFGDRFVNDKGNDSTLSSLNYTKGNSDYVNINGYERHDFAHRLKRPKQQVLDADGVPIEAGDTVWDTVSGIGGVVDNFQSIYGHDITANIECPDDGKFYNFNVDRLTHKEPDTQERIDMDALKGDYEYWGCTGSECHNCPALVDGKKPNQRYGILWCGCAMRLDLLRRQRELDGRGA